MEKFVQNEIREQAVKSGTWFSGLNDMKPIILVLVVSLVLAGIAVANYCGSGCKLF